MTAIADWFPQALVGIVFTFWGCLRLYGLARGIEGGRGKPVGHRLCGT